MLRDNTEMFASELDNLFTKLELADEDSTDWFQLQKYERLEPDVFAWMVRRRHTYLLTLADGGSDQPSIEWLAKWCNGLKAEQLECISADAAIDSRGIQDGFDYIRVYRLPDSYDHQTSYN